MHFGWPERISMGTSFCLFWLGQDRIDSYQTRPDGVSSFGLRGVPPIDGGDQTETDRARGQAEET